MRSDEAPVRAHDRFDTHGRHRVTSPHAELHRAGAGRARPRVGERHDLRADAKRLVVLGDGADLASRRVVGWAMGDTMEVALPLAALRMALTSRRPAAGLIHHSDRGSQGGFKRSSQRLMSEVDDGKVWQTKIESFDTKQIAVTWSAACIGQGGASAILAGDCAWADE